MHDVVDTFYLRDRDGAKVTEPELLAEIEKVLGRRIERRRLPGFNYGSR